MQKRFVESKGKFLTGDKLTLADVQIAAFVFSNFYNDANPLKDQF
jgi:hypothetical protein